MKSFCDSLIFKMIHSGSKDDLGKTVNQTIGLLNLKGVSARERYINYIIVSLRVELAMPLLLERQDNIKEALSIFRNYQKASESNIDICQRGG